MTGTGSAVLISVFWMKMTRYTFPQGTVDFLLLKLPESPDTVRRHAALRDPGIDGVLADT